jgi:hypothetical protein
MFKNKNGPINFVQIFKDWSSNCPEQNGIQKLGGRLPYKNNIVLMERHKNLLGTPSIAFHTQNYFLLASYFKI